MRGRSDLISRSAVADVIFKTVIFASVHENRICEFFSLSYPQGRIFCLRFWFSLSQDSKNNICRRRETLLGNDFRRSGKRKTEEKGNSISSRLRQSKLRFPGSCNFVIVVELNINDFRAVLSGLKLSSFVCIYFTNHNRSHNLLLINL